MAIQTSPGRGIAYGLIMLTCMCVVPLREIHKAALSPSPSESFFQSPLLQGSSASPDTDAMPPALEEAPERSESMLSPSGPKGNDKLIDLKPPKASNPNLPEFLVDKTRFFVLARSDRSGAAILDYLKSLSYALEFGLEFGGICGSFEITDLHQSMVHALGLDTLIKFRSCPTNKMTDYIHGRERIHNRGIAGSFSSPPVLEYIRAVSRARRNPPSRSGRRPEVGVHIRRGDVNPCGYFNRYLPNAFYLQQIAKYSPSADAHVTIYSEAESHESWKDFANYTLSLEDDVTSVWSSMLESDVFILSRSTFSIVPAIVSSRMKTALYLPYANTDPGPLPEWTVCDKADLMAASRITRALVKNCTEPVHNMGPSAQFAKFQWPA